MHLRKGLVIACNFLFLIAIAVCIWIIWSPTFVVWAKNAHGMARNGTWTGSEAAIATFAYWFLELKGRTVTSILLIIAVIAVARRSVR